MSFLVFESDMLEANIAVNRTGGGEIAAFKQRFFGNAQDLHDAIQGNESARGIHNQPA